MEKQNDSPARLILPKSEFQSHGTYLRRVASAEASMAKPKKNRKIQVVEDHSSNHSKQLLTQIPS